MLYQYSVVHAVFFLGLLLFPSLGIAMEDGFFNDGSRSPFPKTTPKREPDFSYPVEDTLNLHNLRWLTGEGQVMGVIESGGIKHVPPGLEGRLLNTLEKNDGTHHSTLVCQVVASQIPGIGLAPEAQVILTAPQVKTEGTILVTLDDAIKWAVRKGAHAINLSIAQTYLKDEPGWINSGFKSREGKATNDFLNGIRYALDHGIPVFTSAGNDKEDLLDDKYLKSIWEAVELSKNSHLFFVVGGFAYPSDISSREDIRFSKNSGRARHGTAHHLFVTGPYNVKVCRPLSVEDRLTKLKKFRFGFDAFELKDIWIKELKEKLETINDAYRTRILPCLTRLETCSNLEHTTQLRNVLSELEGASRGTPLESEMKRFQCNFLGLSLELMTGDSHVEAEERLKLTSPPHYDPRLANGLFEEAILHIDPQTKKPKEITFEEETVSGTSFASPAIATVYLKLRQYATQVNAEGGGATFLSPEDIAACMRATTYQKHEFEEDEEPEWYGCGVIDGEAAFELCANIVEARKTIKDRQFNEGINLWKRIFPILGLYLPPSYYFEVMDAYKSSSEFREGASQKDLLIEFCNKMLSYYPRSYSSHVSDRLKAFVLFEDGKYKECRNELVGIFKKMAKSGKERSIEATLFRRPEMSWVHGVFLPAYDRFKLWINSFLTSERSLISEYIQNGKVYYLVDEHKKLYKLSLAERQGETHLRQLLDTINIGWGRLDDFHNLGKSIFLSNVASLLKNLEGVDVSQELFSEAEKHSAKAAAES